MLSSRPPRKPDLFVVLFLVIAVGMSATLAYQINLYGSGNDKGGMALAGKAQDAAPRVLRR